MEAERKTLPIEMEMKRSGNGKNVNFMIFSTVLAKHYQIRTVVILAKLAV